MRQDILRRDAVAAAHRVQKIVALEHPHDVAARFETMRGRNQTFCDRGREKGVNFDLLVAIEIARLALNSAGNAEQRASARLDLGAALTHLGEREAGTARFEEAVTVWRDSLKELTSDRVPIEWAMTKTNLGATLWLLGERERGTARFKEAIMNLRDALGELTPESAPVDWAKAQTNLGNALRGLGDREGNPARYEEALTTDRNALTGLTRESAPLGWAMANNALRQIAKASKAFRDFGEERSAEYYESQLRRARAAVARLRGS